MGIWSAMSFVDTIGRNPSVSKCNWLHVVIFWFFFWKSEEYSIDSSKITSYFLECLNFTTYFSNSCPDHTKLFVRSQPWDCSGLCQEMDVDPPLFTLLQLEMLTDGVGTGWRDQSLNQFICNERLFSRSLALSVQVIHTRGSWSWHNMKMFGLT